MDTTKSILGSRGREFSGILGFSRLSAEKYALKGGLRFGWCIGRFGVIWVALFVFCILHGGARFLDAALRAHDADQLATAEL
ncbi:hypothetical protein [Thermostilla marina]